VAQDPILAQPITNGHAARMRYSRFRSAMLGLEPQKRNRSGPSKSKVSKSKKDPKTGSTKREDGVKAEEGTEGHSDAYVRSTSPGVVKQEPHQHTYQSQFTPTSVASPSIPDYHSSIQGRLLTPCSDDMMAATHSIAMSPSGSDIFSAHTAFDLAAAGRENHELAHGHSHTHGQGHGHAHGSWTHSPVYSAFDAALDMTHYDVGMCEHNHLSVPVHTHTEEDLGDADAIGEIEEQPPSMTIKHEVLDGPHCSH
jgi:hypothetical protein